MTFPHASPVDLIGESPPMRLLAERTRAAAASRTAVLIVAEAGLAPAAVARAIHEGSRRRGARFLVFDCGAGDPEAVEARLLGPRSRARHGRNGGDLEVIAAGSRLDEARGGTLLLDGVADLPAAVQARLARLARDGDARLEALGPAVPLNLRLMAGARPGLEAEVASGRFREDLYRRLAKFRIDMPPLRERAEDIPLLARVLVDELCRASGQSRTLTRAAQTLLAALPWRRNIEELQAVLERLVAEAPGPAIRQEDVLAFTSVGMPAAMAGGTLREARRRFEREYVLAVLRQTGWKMGEAARTLGIERTNLYRKVRQLGIAAVREAKRS